MINCLTKKIKNIFINLEKIDIKIMKFGLRISLLILVIFSFVLLFNLTFLHSLLLYKIGILSIKSTLYFAIEFIICGIVVDGIKHKNI